MWFLGISDEDGSLCYCRSCGFWAVFGWIVMKNWLSLVPIGFWCTGCLMVGLVGFLSEDSMYRTRAGQSYNQCHGDLLVLAS